MDEKIFKNLQKHVFDKDNPWDIWDDGSKKELNKLPYFSTWAIWKGSTPEERKDLTLINPENAYRLKPNIVFVALNFKDKLVSNWHNWQNIHDEEVVYDVLHGPRGTRYEGAYMTDIIKNYPEPESEIVREYVKTGKIDINANINWFFEEIKLLGEDTIEMYLFGDCVESLFKDYVKRHEKFPEFRRKVKKCQRIYHYGKRNRERFKRYAPVQLGIDSIDGVKTYPPLWDDLEESVEPPKRSSKVILVKKGTGEEKIVR